MPGHPYTFALASGSPFSGAFARCEDKDDGWLEDAYFGPKPIQKPHPPIHVGGVFPGGARRAARWADGWIPISGRGEGDLAEQIADLRRMAEDRHRDPDELEVTIYQAPAEPGALVDLAEAGVHRVLFGLPSVPESAAMESLESFAACRDAAGLIRRGRNATRRRP